MRPNRQKTVSSVSQFVSRTRDRNSDLGAHDDASLVDMETTEYEFAISPSALDTSQLKPPIDDGRASNSPRSPIPARSASRTKIITWSRRSAASTRSCPPTSPKDQLPAHVRRRRLHDVRCRRNGRDGCRRGRQPAGDHDRPQAVKHSPKWGFKINKKEARELFERVRDHVQAIDETLTERSEADHRLFGMGTTLTVAYSVGVDLFIIHLGDSRAYLFRKADLQLLTKDHTVAQAMADAGYIAPEEVRHHRKRHVLTNFLGGHHGKVKADVRWLRLADGDRLLLCSDGLTDMVDDASIAEILLKHEKPKDAAQTLLDEALLRGGRDNVTIIVAEITQFPPPRSRMPVCESVIKNPSSSTWRNRHHLNGRVRLL